MTPLPNEQMTTGERRAAATLSGIFGLRMLGLFMILPVFALYAEHLDGVTPTLVGLAIGAYGLTQALLQIPAGMLSDRIGRKPVMVAGLLLFAAGSVLAAMSDTIHWVIVGRALQGAGAIASTVMALLADLTREEHRTKAMAFMGISIGVSFALAMVAGPVLNHWIGVPGIFWLTGALALAAIAVVILLVPTPRRSGLHRDTEPVPALFGKVLRNGELLRLNYGIFSLHLLLTASFTVVPLALRDFAGLASGYHSFVYLGVMGGSLLVMVPAIILAEKKRRIKTVFLAAVALIAFAELGLWRLHGSLFAIVVALFAFFAAFNILEATLPSLVSKVAPPDSKGTAMGFYSSSQFLGAFIGGAMGGWLHGRYGIEGVFLGSAVVAALWWLVAVGMRHPSYLSSYLLRIGPVDDAQARLLSERLAGVAGVAEAVVVAEDQTAYLKVDRSRLDEEALQQYAVA
ncbi:MAG: MFS transporter [Gammaproteobacteria bacterium]|nr:MFS transporter [Gammaproteobacteria bacterium]